MSRRIEISFDALDEMGRAILSNKIPIVERILDPNTGKDASWPESFEAYKRSVQQREKAFDREPLTNLQWQSMRAYMESQFGFEKGATP